MNQKILYVIPARSGSKGIPNKNMAILQKKPLLYYSLSAALELGHKNDVCLSTDDPIMKSYAEKTFNLEVPFLRPAKLSTDTIGTYEVLLHAIDFYLSEFQKKYDGIILLQPTSPLRTTKQIDEAKELFSKNNGIDMVVSVKKAKSSPYFNLFEEDDNGYLKHSKPGHFTRRQDCPDVWEYNGAIYVINIASLRKRKLHEFESVIKYEMDEATSVDIDTEKDLLIAEYYLKKLKNS